MTALVFDDEEALRALMTDFLTSKQFKTTTYPNPKKYLENCCSCGSSPCFDVILTDNQMPYMTGLEFLTKTKESGCKIPDCRMAIMSGNLSSEELVRAKALGCRVFHKPTPVIEILEWLDECRELDE